MAAEATVAPPRPASTDVYRCYDGDGGLLYVGISHALAARLDAHRHPQPWWEAVARIEVEHLPTRAEAIAREAALIARLHPRHNRIGVTAEVCERLCELDGGRGRGRQTREERNTAGSSPLAGRMLAWRTRYGLTQAQAAALLRTTGNTWARWERGHTWPNRGWRERVVALLAQGPGEARRLVASEYRRFREDHGLRVAEVAQTVGVSPRAWYAWEAGEYSPRAARRVFRLIDHLDTKAGFVERGREAGDAR